MPSAGTNRLRGIVCFGLLIGFVDNLKNIGRFQPHPPVLNTDAICHRMILISVFCSSYFVSLKLVDGAPSRSPVGAE